MSKSSKPTRRDFVQGSLLAGAALLPACTRNAHDDSATTQPTTRPANKSMASDKPVGANERLRIAVVGVRGRGMSHVDAYTGMKDAEIVAICDVDDNVVGKAMKEVEQKTGKRRHLEDFRYLLADRSIDAVSLATCNHVHALHTVWAVQAGKDVYVEKPMTHNVWEGRQIMAAAEKYDRIVQNGTQSRSNGAAKEAVKFMNGKHELGKFKVCRAFCYKPRNSIGQKPDELIPPIGVDYNLWLGPAPVRPFNANRFHYEWHWNFEYGNGDLGNQGVHQMDVAIWGIGADDLPRKVMSYGGRLGYEDDGNTPNTQVCWLDWGGDRAILYEVRGLDTKQYKELKDVGKITVLFEYEKGFVQIGGKTGVFNEKGECTKEFKGSGVSHFRNFVDVVKSRKLDDLNAPPLAGHISAACCHLANISYRVGQDQSFSADPPPNGNDILKDAYTRFTQHLKDNKVDLEKSQLRVGKTLAFDPRTERFTNDEKANTMLTRDYRKPFILPEII